MYKFLPYLVYIFALVSILLPQNLFAAELIFNLTQDLKVVEVRINPQSKEMNVLEGEIKFSGPASRDLSVQIENGESVLPIWPTPPQYNSYNRSIVFVGGVPNGFSSEGLLFRMRLNTTNSGNLNISYVDGRGYLNDGKGTVEQVSSTKLNIKVSEDGSIAIYEPSGTYKYVIIILIIVSVLLVTIVYAIKKYKK